MRCLLVAAVVRTLVSAVRAIDEILECRGPGRRGNFRSDAIPRHAPFVFAFCGSDATRPVPSEVVLLPVIVYINAAIVSDVRDGFSLPTV